MKTRTLYYVYVILLQPKAGEVRPRGAKSDLYVGSSTLTPNERFQKHLSGERSSRHVRRRGLRLLPSLYDRVNPLTSLADAKRAEQRLADSLNRRGHRIFGACRPNQDRGCKF